MNQKKKILFVIPSFRFGGTCSSLKSILRTIERDFDISILALSSYGQEKAYFSSYKILEPDKLLYFWEVDSRSLKNKTFVCYIVKIFRKFTSMFGLNFASWVYRASSSKQYLKGFDIVVGFQEGVATYFVSYLVCNRKISWVHCNLRYSNYSHKDNIKAYQKYDDIVFVSNTTKSVFVELYPLLKDKTQTIYNIIDYENISKQSQEPLIDKCQFDRFTIVSVGRLAPIKRFHLIPSMVKELKARGKNVQWLILGEGSERQKIQDEIVKNNVENDVLMLGYISNPAPYLKSSDLYVCTSQSEACPMVFLESYLLGTYVLSTDFSSAFEIIDSITGRISTQEDLVQSIVEIMENPVKVIPNIELQNNNKLMLYKLFQ